MIRIVLSVIAIMFVFSTFAAAEDLRIMGVIEQIDGTNITIKDSRTGKIVTVIAKDELTLKRLKDKRITVGDEVRVKYDSMDMTIRVFSSGCTAG